MQFGRELRRLLLVFLVLFGLVALSAAYWAIVGPNTILQREDNPRLVEAAVAIDRGDIVGRTGELLVSTSSNGRIATRTYAHPPMNSALGYYSYRYGTNGVEAAYDALLSGAVYQPGFNTQLQQSLLHRPRVGADVQVSFDLMVQQAAVEAMQGQTGAAVTLTVPGGEVLSLVSLPTYDPNLLDTQWNELTAASGRPFFNRATQSTYQPGILETPLIGAALLLDQPIDTLYENGTANLVLDDLTLTCAVNLPPADITLRQAYAYACPAPFAQLAQTLGPDVVAATLDTFQLDRLTVLPGYAPRAPGIGLSRDDHSAQHRAANAHPTPLVVTQATLVETALGQSNLTVSPLKMALIAAAIANDGNAPTPYTLMAVRPPGTTDWRPQIELRPSLPITTLNTARQLQDLMREAVVTGAAQNAGRPNIDIGGHAALAYSGEQTLAWFIGFTTLPNGQAVVTAVVLENTADVGLAADIGGTILAAAHTSLQTQPLAQSLTP